VKSPTGIEPRESQRDRLAIGFNSRPAHSEVERSETSVFGRRTQWPWAFCDEQPWRADV